MIDEYADELKRCEELDDCRTWEGQAAIVYWKVWADFVRVPLSPRDLLLVQGHWHRFAGRTSLAWDGYQRNKDATDPIDAMLNYLYPHTHSRAVSRSLWHAVPHGQTRGHIAGPRCHHRARGS